MFYQEESLRKTKDTLEELGLSALEPLVVPLNEQEAVTRKYGSLF